ncbi:MAG: hypothetical protein AAFN92_22490, partial [Bacteroidota bacterium]
HQLTPSFHLEVREENDWIRYRFSSRGTVSPGNSIVAEGTGLRYVSARLREAYGDKWSLKQGPTPNGWETLMRVPA